MAQLVVVMENVEANDTEVDKGNRGCGDGEISSRSSSGGGTGVGVGACGGIGSGEEGGYQL